MHATVLQVMPMSVFDDVMAVNVSGVVRVTKEALPLLRAVCGGGKGGQGGRQGWGNPVLLLYQGMTR